MAVIGLLQLSLVAPWFALLWIATLFGMNKLLLMLWSIKSHRRYSAWCSSCWQLPLNLRLLELWTFGSDVTGDAAVMTGRQASFVWMLLYILCRIMISILTNNIAITFYMSPMRKDIFRRERIFNFTFPQSILLNPRPVGFQQITIWPNMTNLPTIKTSRNKLTMSLCTCIFGFWLHTIMQARIFRIIQTSSVYYHRLNNNKI
jgi:hypothetical protein